VTALLTLFLLFGVAAPLSAQTLDPAGQEALAATLTLLGDPALRAAAIAGSPQAAAIDTQVQGLTGSPQLAQEFYELAGQVFDELVRTSGGDIPKMNEALDRAKGDPAAFAALLSPDTLQRLRELAVKISDRPRR
jgi:hypothetical protein